MPNSVMCVHSTSNQSAQMNSQDHRSTIWKGDGQILQVTQQVSRGSHNHRSVTSVCSSNDVLDRHETNQDNQDHMSAVWKDNTEFVRARVQEKMQAKYDKGHRSILCHQDAPTSGQVYSGRAIMNLHNRVYKRIYAAKTV